MDATSGYASGFKGDRRFRFEHQDVVTFDSSERFDLCLLFGVVTYLDASSEAQLYRNVARMLADDGRFIVKNQCSDGLEFRVDSMSDKLGQRYVGRYPSIDEQAERLAATYERVEIRRYPDSMRVHETSSHVAFVCSEPR